MSMSDIANMKIDVDGHLCEYEYCRCDAEGRIECYIWFGNVLGMMVRQSPLSPEH
jgi:hypothetical protein